MRSSRGFSPRRVIALPLLAEQHLNGQHEHLRDRQHLGGDPGDPDDGHDLSVDDQRNIHSGPGSLMLVAGSDVHRFPANSGIPGAVMQGADAGSIQ
ncbi:hypothetical protein [Cryobacterium sp. PH31-L1]|uniref:hypothetical protein n=1 Tax=Cryobacterium sp. PH31-L1 TaxID=3046199 RepID=UPI0024B8DB78|nr:hypothetical protein [Cryobacterium sp. PH31-L1]MDJ0378184.1 hypothetical protein [Cryobacterium sp. PH31-L1]